MADVSVKKLFLLYDAQCPVCLRWRQWLGAQATLTPLNFIPFQSPELVDQLEGIKSFLTNNQLLAVGDDGAVYQDSNALITLLYCLRDYREWAFRLAVPCLQPWTAQCFDLLSSGRKNISKWLTRLSDSELLDVLRTQPVPLCIHGLSSPR